MEKNYSSESIVHFPPQKASTFFNTPEFLSLPGDAGKQFSYSSYIRRRENSNFPPLQSGSLKIEQQGVGGIKEEPPNLGNMASGPVRDLSERNPESWMESKKGEQKPQLESRGEKVKELQGHVKMREDVSYFNEKYGNFFQNISQKLGLDENKMRSLISHESRFQAGAKNVLGSKGYMQLTSAPIRDIQSRPQLYAPLFQKIDIESLPEDAPKELKELIRIFQTGKQEYPKIKNLIPGLLAKKDQPHTNLVIGSVYAAMLEGRLDARAQPEKIAAFVDSRIQKLSQGEFLSMVSRRVRDVLPEAKLGEIRASIKGINTFEDHKDFLQFRDYNGNTSKYKNGIEHRDIYAAVVSVINKLSGTQLDLQKRIK